MRVDIKPGVGVLSSFKFMKYTYHHALAEYIDNSLDSYLQNRSNLGNQKLTVKIEFNSVDKKITISDDAAGIDRSDFVRAFKTASPPPNSYGLSEFGMGLKSASCWFASEWKVITKTQGDRNEYVVSFNVPYIVDNDINNLDIEPIDRNNLDSHYTTVELTRLNGKFPTTRTVGKIKSHLTSIYREYLRSGDLILLYNGKPLCFEEPRILNAPFYNSDHQPVGESRTWKKDIDFTISESISVKGFVGILEKGSTTKGGLSLFRRGRVILGSADEGYKPRSIFKGGNSFESQRLFGELHLMGFDVTHTKDGFREGENMELFIDLLKDDLSFGKNSFIKQVQNYRKTPTVESQKKKFADVLKVATSAVAEDLDDKLEVVSSSPLVDEDLTDLPEHSQKNYEEIIIHRKDQTWRICIELSYEDRLSDWIELGDNFIDTDTGQKGERKIGIRLAMQHSFMVRYAVLKRDSISSIIRLAATIGLAEIVARGSGIKNAGMFRVYINEFLKRELKFVDNE